MWLNRKLEKHNLKFNMGQNVGVTGLINFQICFNVHMGCQFIKLLIYYLFIVTNPIMMMIVTVMNHILFSHHFHKILLLMIAFI